MSDFDPPGDDELDAACRYLAVAWALAILCFMIFMATVAWAWRTV